MTLSKAERLRQVAYHEAGHAVMAWNLGRKITAVTIVPDVKAGNLGSCSHPKSRNQYLGGDYSIATRKRAENEIMCNFAGPIAQRYVTGRQVTWGSDGDHNQVMNVGVYTTVSIEEAEAFLNWLWIRARDQLTNSFHWPIVEAVAAALLDRQTISGDDVRAIARQILQGVPESRSERDSVEVDGVHS